MDFISSTQEASTLLNSSFPEFTSSDGASVLAVTELSQEFYLEYAQNHLNDTDNVTITMGKFGECSFLITPISELGGGGGRNKWKVPQKKTYCTDISSAITEQ